MVKQKIIRSDTFKILKSNFFYGNIEINCFCEQMWALVIASICIVISTFDIFVTITLLDMLTMRIFWISIAVHLVELVINILVVLAQHYRLPALYLPTLIITVGLLPKQRKQTTNLNCSVRVNFTSHVLETRKSIKAGKS